MLFIFISVGGNMGNLTHIFQMDWNHPPVKVLSAFITSRNQEENHHYRFHFYGRLEYVQICRCVRSCIFSFKKCWNGTTPKKIETCPVRSLKIFTLVFFCVFLVLKLWTPGTPAGNPLPPAWWWRLQLGWSGWCLKPGWIGGLVA